MFRFAAAAALALLAVPAVAQNAADPATAEPAAVESGGTPARMSQLLVFGNDPCPRSNAEEIVVCARLPESERYRVPKRFRGKRNADAPAPDTWTNRAAELETVNRAGLPNSCSPIGANGQTGCFQKFLRDARDQRREQQTEQADVP